MIVKSFISSGFEFDICIGSAVISNKFYDSNQVQIKANVSRELSCSMANTKRFIDNPYKVGELVWFRCFVVM